MGRTLTIALLGASLALAGCGGQSPRAVSAPLPAVTPPSSAPRAKPAPAAEPAMHIPGLAGVIGARADRLLEQFGTPRIDLKEGSARKLQFAGPPCVLDIFLYPPDGGGEPVATHVEARRASDGQAVDRGQCVSALRKN
ncbi:MAG: hypothetical protein P0Y56_10400 [Candidatus Andeanibacterium colombiense]|uniref:Uncharacterized protein n=1 Tax=Candidatus Andeanibacterium colombiense TaxID=3121345 RepID=A0AAJ6BLK1_9SPHN|nr:MAG: hypothetical protein P0Y56_10400 [Sphingomonadaceae bacterium]